MYLRKCLAYPVLTEIQDGVSAILSEPFWLDAELAGEFAAHLQQHHDAANERCEWCTAGLLLCLTQFSIEGLEWYRIHHLDKRRL